MTVHLKMNKFTILILIYLISGISSEEPCGDWEAYKNEKCLKIFENAGLLGYGDAENYCKAQEDSHLLSIDLEDKQRFIETFLKSNSVLDNVWIGLKYVNNAYQWTDGTSLQYTNWASDSPKNNESYCVQIRTETSEFGLWSDELCGKRNLVLCEKTQLWPLAQLQTAVMNLMNELTVLKKEIIPVGFIYVQLPGKESAMAIWPSLEWKDVSSDYAGLFFRTEGGNAAEFGEVQEEGAPRLVHMRTSYQTSNYISVPVSPNGAFCSPLKIRGNQDLSSGWDLEVMVSKEEVKPRNTAIKIWMRID